MTLWKIIPLLSENLPESQQITLITASISGKNRWAIRKGVPHLIDGVYQGYWELSKKGVWDIPPHPAGMSYAWIKQHRWNDPNEALAFWTKYYNKLKK
jgi:hypothetical protein